MASKYNVVFVLGGPGSGKGTQCAKIVEKFSYVHLSAGDLLREERASGSEVATLINDYINRGAIVPVEITIGLIEKAMVKSGADKFLVDGFPRNADNLQGWERVMNDKAEVKFVLYLECPTETCIERVLERGRSSGRGDDNIEVMRKRLQTYENETRPIIDIFAQRNLVRTVQSTKPVDEVFADVEALF